MTEPRALPGIPGARWRLSVAVLAGLATVLLFVLGVLTDQRVFFALAFAGAVLCAAMCCLVNRRLHRDRTTKTAPR